MGQEHQIQVEREIGSMQRDITDMKLLMGRMVEAMAKITVIEERQHAMSQATNKVLERMETIAQHQHEQDILAATNGSLGSRVAVLETAIRELHLEDVRKKARAQTLVWAGRCFWTLFGAGGAIALAQTFINAAPK